jgi:hypothetical protein
MGRIGILALVLLGACGGGSDEEDGEDQGQSCGDSLTCGDGEFCLSYLPAGASTGEEEYSCEAFPDGCDSFDAMCFDDPACVEDWSAVVCPADTFSSGCVSFGGSEEAFCQGGSYAR